MNDYCFLFLHFEMSFAVSQSSVRSFSIPALVSKENALKVLHVVSLFFLYSLFVSFLGFPFFAYPFFLWPSLLLFVERGNIMLSLLLLPVLWQKLITWMDDIDLNPLPRFGEDVMVATHYYNCSCWWSLNMCVTMTIVQTTLESFCLSFPSLSLSLYCCWFIIDLKCIEPH